MLRSVARLRIERLATLLCVALCASLLTTVRAASTHASTAAAPASNGFAGPTSSAPRRIDRDIEPATRGALHRVPCAAAGTSRCWIAAR
jgi:hypothetical protein